MSRIERISKKLQEKYPTAEVLVEDKTQEHLDYRTVVDSLGPSESDLHLEVKAEEFETMSLLEATREINRLIKDEFAKGLHSVSIECYPLPKKTEETD